MFTGIVQRSIKVVGVAHTPRFRRLTVACPWDDVRVGESIAINGVCLTVAEISPGELGFDAVAETLSKTNLGLLKNGDDVHAERALRVGDRIDGHFVQGHVDGLAVLVQRTDNECETRLRLRAPASLSEFLIPRGSVAIDGVSLTIADLNGDHFEVALIPTTVMLTALAHRAEGWQYNLEVDILSKSVVSYLHRMHG